MSEWSQILGVLAAFAMIWFMYRGIKNNPEMLSRANLSKSFFTMGVVGLALIAFVALCILLLRT